MLRPDRHATLLWSRLRSFLNHAGRNRAIPILMYHGVSHRDDMHSLSYFVTNTRPEVFRKHMEYLACNHYNVISLSDAVALISGSPISDSSPITDHRSPVTGAPRYAVITFDDGYRDFHDVAWPILKKHNFPATMYLPTGLINDDRKILEGKECMTWPEVVALAGEGAEFGAHSVSHVQLYDIYSNKSLSFPRRRESIETLTPIDYELRASKQAIEEKLGRPVEHYSYALAFPEHDPDFVGKYETSLRNAGYRSAVSTRIGTAQQGDNVYTLKRIPINSLDDIPLFRAKLEGGYDWMHAVQFASKSVTSKRKHAV